MIVGPPDYEHFGPQKLLIEIVSLSFSEQNTEGYKMYLLSKIVSPMKI